MEQEEKKRVELSEEVKKRISEIHVKMVGGTV